MKTKPTKSPIIQFIAKNISKMDSEEFYAEAYRRFKVPKPNMRHYVWRYRRKNGIEDNWGTKPGQQSVSDSLSKKASKNQSIDALVDQFDIVKRQPIQVGKITMSQGEPVRAVPIESNGPTEQERRAVWVACFAQLIPRLLADTAAANADICLAEFDKRFTK